MGSSLKVLLVDDEPHVLDALVRTVRQVCPGWTLQTVTNGDAALLMLAREPYDVLVTDLHMPGLNGNDLGREVLMRYPWIVRIVLTGMVDQRSFDQGTKWSQRFLTKPCSSEVLCTEIKTALQRRDRDRALSLQHAVSAVDPVILQVEDNYGDVVLFRQALSSNATSVQLVHVQDGERALTLLRREGEFAAVPAPHLILLDLGLPGMNGYEFMARYRAEGTIMVPIIVLSGSQRESDRDEAIRHGAAAFLSKPSTIDRYVELARNVTMYATLTANAR